MVEAQKQSRFWWFENHQINSPRRSQWLQSTLSELDEKTRAMLKLIEEDADSFAQRAEMYYKKRPELINMVEDFYRTHRSLAERYDQVKSESGTRLITPWASPLSFKYRSEKLRSSIDKSYDSYSETYDSDESGESEVDDPEVEEEEIQVDEEIEEDEVSSGIGNKVMNLKEEIERLKEENKMNKEQILQKDEEKREVIRQLSVAVNVLKEENVKLRKYIAKEPSKKWTPPEFSKLKGVFWGKLFNGSPRSEASIIAL